MKSFFLITISTIILYASSIFSEGYISKLEPDSPIVQSKSTYKVLVERDITYGEGLSHANWNSSKSKTMPLKLDIYTPENDIKNRPVYMFVHGGGFAGGSKNQGKIINLANYYTSRGWVFVSINYRLKKNKGSIPQKWYDHSKKLPNSSKIEQYYAIYPAIRDSKAALRWIVANAETYNINTDYITVGGASAGAITAISIGVSNQEDFRDELSIEQDPTLKTTNLNTNYKIKTIVDYWGSKVALDAHHQIFGHKRFNSNSPALFIAHGTEDPTVNFKNAKDLKSIYEKHGAPYKYYPLEGKGHGAWEAKVNNKSLEILTFDYIVKQQKLIVHK